jgi:hypothetical protein
MPRGHANPQAGQFFLGATGAGVGAVVGFGAGAGLVCGAGAGFTGAAGTADSASLARRSVPLRGSR